MFSLEVITLVFLRTTKQTYVNVFLDNYLHICGNYSIGTMDKVDVLGVEGNVITSLNYNAWIKFVCSVYLMKHKTLYNSEKIESLYSSMTCNPPSQTKGLSTAEGGQK